MGVKSPRMNKRAIKAEAKYLAAKWVKEIREEEEEKEAIRQEARELAIEWFGTPRQKAIQRIEKLKG